MYRVVSKTSETRASLDKYGVDYLLNLHEALCLEDYVNALHQKDSAIKKEQAKRMDMVAKQIGKLGL